MQAQKIEVSPVPLQEEAKPQIYYERPLLVFSAASDSTLYEAPDKELGSYLAEQQTCLCDSLIDYHMQWLCSGCRTKADTWRNSRRLTFTNYGEVFAGNPVNWMLGSDGEANLSWQLHSFFFLRDFAASHQVTKDHGYLEACDALLASWASEALVADPKPRFAWNDHSTAYRLHALTQYYIYLLGLDIPPKNRLAELYRFIVRHQAVLLSRHLYSKGTNHGLDQAFYLYVSAVVVPEHSETFKVRSVALQRLRYELLRSFAEDGVHIENSPEYHDLVLNSVSFMSHLVASVESSNELLTELQTRLFQGVKFLAYIVRPDGLIPTIGDSTQIPPRSRHTQLSAAPAYSAFLHASSRGSEGCDTLPDSAVFPSSGYAVFRDQQSVPTNLRMHAIFKCGFLSTYHRHDDDNSIVLYAGGEDWLVDGGLYKYEELDPHRIYVRSARAHNLMLPLGVSASRNIGQVQAQLVRNEITPEHVSVCGVTTMFPGFHYKRTFDFESFSRKLLITDAYFRQNDSTERNQQYELLLHFPQDKKITISGMMVLVSSTTSSAVLQIMIDPKGMQSTCIMNYTEGNSECCRSIAYGQIDKTQSIRILYLGTPDLSVTTRLDLSGIPHRPCV